MDFNRSIKDIKNVEFNITIVSMSAFNKFLFVPKPYYVEAPLYTNPDQAKENKESKC